MSWITQKLNSSQLKIHLKLQNVCDQHDSNPEKKKLKSHASVALIKGDGIGIDVSEAAIEIAHQATKRIGGCNFTVEETLAGAGYFQDTGHDVEPGGEVKVGRADAIFLGAIGLPSIR